MNTASGIATLRYFILSQKLTQKNSKTNSDVFFVIQFRELKLKKSKLGAQKKTEYCSKYSLILKKCYVPIFEKKFGNKNNFSRNATIFDGFYNKFGTIWLIKTFEPAMFAFVQLAKFMFKNTVRHDTGGKY